MVTKPQWRPPPLPKNLQLRVWKNAKVRNTTMQKLLVEIIETSTEANPKPPEDELTTT